MKRQSASKRGKADLRELERRQVDALRASEERFRALTTASSQVVYRMSPDWNEMRLLVGHDFIPDTLDPSDTWLQRYVHPDDQPQVQEVLREAIRTKGVFELEYRVRRVDGGFAWVASRAVPLLDDQGEIVEWFGAASDITARKEAEQALRDSQRRQAFLLKLSDALRPLADAAEIQATATLTTREALGADRCYYCEIEGNSSIIRRDSAREGFPSVAGVYPLDGLPMFTKVLAGGQPFVVDDSHTTDLLDEELRRLCIQMQIISSLNVPVVKAGKSVGILCITQAGPRSWSKLDIELAAEAAERTWTAVERARVEAALRESQAQQGFQAHLLANAAEVMVAADEHGVLTYWNRAAEELFGWSAEEVLGRSSTTVLGTNLSAVPGDAAGLDQGEQVFRRKDASAVLAEVRVASLRGPGGEPRGSVAGLRDITARKQSEEALRASNERLRKVLEVETVGVMFWDLATGRMTDANDAFLNLMGYSRRDVEAGELTWQKLTPPEYVDVSLAELEKFKVCGRIGPYEKEYLHKDGTRQWLVFAGSSLGGNACVEFCVDISGRKRAEAALRESEERYRSLFESIDEGFCIIEMLFDEHGKAVDYRFLEMNPAFVAQTGLRHAKGHTIRELVPQQEQRWFDVYGEIALTGRPARFEQEARYLDPPRWYDVYAFRYGPPEKRQVAVLFNDVYPRKLAEEARRQANLELAEADRRKTEFLAVLSHELRNPLAPIANCLYILDRVPPGGEQAERAKQVIGRQVAQLAHLVNDLLDVTRISRNKVQLHQEPLDLVEVVRRAVEDHRTLFERAGVKLEPTLPSVAVPVLADRTRIAQIVGNLLQNAAKFTRRGGSTRVSVEVDGGAATIRVVDNGIGMTPETLQRLFQPFAQAEQTLDRSTGGLGIGLALVKGLAELHGGTVAAHSAGVGQGSELVVRLPIDPKAAAEATSGAGPGPRARRRILVIEDNVDAADSLSEALALGDHEIAVAYNGPDGIRKARQFHPDLVFCDIGLPGMDGYDVARAFRADDALKHARLVALSGYAQPEDVERASAAGFERHLAKPPSMEKVQSVLASLPPSGGT